MAETSGEEALQVEEDIAEQADENDLLRRFEALSKSFRSEVQVLFGQEKEASKDLQRLQARNAELERQLQLERQEVRTVKEAVEDVLSQVEMSPGASLQELVQALIEVSAAKVRPEVLQAQAELAKLQSQLEAVQGEADALRADLKEAMKLKSEEERDLIEFKALREKENELQSSRLEVQELKAELEEKIRDVRQLEDTLAQQSQSVRQSSEKIQTLVQQLEQGGEQVRLLSDENNTLRLELGRDTDYLKVLAASEPLSYRSGALEDGLAAEDQRFREELRGAAAKFPGLAGKNSSSWCELQVSRASELHLSCLHRLQDVRKDFPEDLQVEFISPTEEAQKDWLQQEAQMTQASAEFQEAETRHGRRWEEHRLKLTVERDQKVKQLLEQAERSQSKAEKQLLLHQAKLYGQRIDGQLEKAWEEQRKERDVRWSQHQRQKHELRQKIKDDSLALLRRAEDQALASRRFSEVACSKLAAVEDSWLRNAEKAAALNASAFKGKDFAASLQQVKSTIANAAVSLSCCTSKQEQPVPLRGSQFTGVQLAVDQVEELLQNRALLRSHLREDLELQSRQQLRSCMERFILREEENELSACKQAASIAGILQMRHYRHFRDVMRRQFQDFLMVLRLCLLAAQWLLPGSGQEDLCPLKSESQQQDEETNLYGKICQQLLDRTLRVLSDLQRDELLSLKRKNAAELRVTLQSLCQLEPKEVEKAQRLEQKEFETQITLRLLSDAQRQVNEEHKRQVSKVSRDVESQMAHYRREMHEKEQAILEERQKWLGSRILMLQNGSNAERSLMARLRAELEACEAKVKVAVRPELWKIEVMSSPPRKRSSKTKLPVLTAR